MKSVVSILGLVLVMAFGMAFGTVALADLEVPSAAGSAPGSTSAYGAPSDCPICRRDVAHTSAPASADTVGERLASDQPPAVPVNIVPAVQADETKATH